MDDTKEIKVGQEGGLQYLFTILPDGKVRASVYNDGDPYGQHMVCQSEADAIEWFGLMLRNSVSVVA